jgi:UDP-GlcNAc:undecaprenyl-phosphate GlcNAc-1-phosphate transferase
VPPLALAAGPLFSFFDPSEPQEQFLSRPFLEALAKHVGPAVEPFLLAAGLCVLLTPLAILSARRLGVMAVPQRERDIHRRPTPRLGGPALYLAFAGAVAATQHLDPRHAGILALTGIAALVFLADDRWGLPAWSKLLLQVALALAAVLVLQLTVSFLNVPGSGIVHLGVLSLPLTLFWLLGMQNTVNLLDGVDGLAAGVVAIVALTLLIAAASRQQPDVVVLSAALAGACAGFLLFNFHPARIFMGDSGSHFLGLALGLLSILGVAKVAVTFALLIPALALAIPIADTAWAVVRRRRRGLSIAHADSRHVHHQLLDFGLSQPQTCLLFYSATGILGAIGLMLFGHRRILSVAIVLLVVVLSTVAGEQLERSGWRVPAPGLALLLRDRALR